MSFRVVPIRDGHRCFPGVLVPVGTGFSHPRVSGLIMGLIPVQLSKIGVSPKS